MVSQQYGCTGMSYPTHSDAKKISRRKEQRALSNIQRERLDAQLDHYSDSETSDWISEDEESWQGCSESGSGTWE
jgi:hypothetical protein